MSQNQNENSYGSNIIELGSGYDSAEESTTYSNTHGKSHLDTLKSDRSCKGQLRFNFYRLCLFINHFQYPLILTISLTTGAIAQLLFLETSDNITQGVLYGWITSIATFMALLLIYGTCLLCGKGTVTIGSPSHISYMITLGIILAITILSMLKISKNCFDENGNYRKPEIDEYQEVIIYCDFKTYI